MRILIADDLSQESKAILERIPGAQVDFKAGLAPDALRAIIGGDQALAVRSATLVTKDLLAAATKLRVVGRAGTGVDNIDLDAATRRGVVVMNAPGVVGNVGLALGEAQVNIASLAPARDRSRGEALALVSVDSPATNDLLEKPRRLPNVRRVHQVVL